MNDPHVKYLKYTIAKSDGLRFDDPPDLEIDTSDFKGMLSNGILTLEPKQHFESEDQVLPIADEFVRSWELSAGLKYNRPYFRLNFHASQIIDRKPEKNLASVHNSSHTTCSGEVTSVQISREYPPPPQNFNLTEEIEILWFRYCEYLEDRAPLKYMTYACHTLLQNLKNISKNNDEEFSISNNVLVKISELSSQKGNKRTARKIIKNLKDFEGNEKQWLESVIPSIIKHLATCKPGQKLNISDLPIQLKIRDPESSSE